MLSSAHRRADLARLARQGWARDERAKKAPLPSSNVCNAGHVTGIPQRATQVAGAGARRTGNPRGSRRKRTVESTPGFREWVGLRGTARERGPRSTNTRREHSRLAWRSAGDEANVATCKARDVGCSRGDEEGRPEHPGPSLGPLDSWSTRCAIRKGGACAEKGSMARCCAS